MDAAQSKNLTVNEAAERLRVSAPTLNRWRCKGTGPKFIKAGGRVLYREDDLAAFENENQRQGTRAIE
jgi:excisionase family DNA binding protein